MWPYMGQMGWWMVLWWVSGLAIVVVLIWAIARAAGGGSSPRAEDSPEAILKRRYARGELDREEYQRRLEDLTRRHDMMSAARGRGPCEPRQRRGPCDLTD